MQVPTTVIILTVVLVFVYMFMSSRRTREVRTSVENTCPCRNKPQVMGVYMPSMNSHPMHNRPDREYRY